MEEASSQSVGLGTPGKNSLSSLRDHIGGSEGAKETGILRK